MIRNATVDYECKECGFSGSVDVINNKATCSSCGTTNDVWEAGDAPPPNHRSSEPSTSEIVRELKFLEGGCYKLSMPRVMVTAHMLRTTINRLEMQESIIAEQNETIKETCHNWSDSSSPQLRRDPFTVELIRVAMFCLDPDWCGCRGCERNADSCTGMMGCIECKATLHKQVIDLLKRVYDPNQENDPEDSIIKSLDKLIDQMDNHYVKAQVPIATLAVYVNRGLVRLAEESTTRAETTEAKLKEALSDIAELLSMENNGISRCWVCNKKQSCKKGIYCSNPGWRGITESKDDPQTEEQNGQH